MSADDEQARYPPEVESAGYYAVSEALTNVLKHSGAVTASVRAARTGDGLVITVTDDGVGIGDGAETGEGSGLAGLRDRVEALGGRLVVGGRPSGGTTLEVVLPSGAGP